MLYCIHIARFALRDARRRITTVQNIYLDNAATSVPKAPGVADAMTQYLCGNGANLNRGGYAAATDAEMTALTLRETLCQLFGSPEPEACILTPGATFALNQVFKGTLHAGDHVLVSSVEHNAVMRPLNQIGGLEVEKVPCAADGTMQAGDLIRRMRPDTRMVCLTHASNVCGSLLPIHEVGAACRHHGVAYVVDAAQTAGHLPLSRTAIGADALVLPAHKGLLGPQGIGALLMSRAFAETVTPLVAGGTGSRSSQETQPADLPDKFESGTQNIPGIYGFLAALAYVAPNQEALHATAMRLCGLLLDGVRGLAHVRLLGIDGLEGRVPTVALDFTGMDNGDVAGRLSREFGIATRSGLQCAPSAHVTLGSFPQGAVRFSLSGHNTEAEIVETLAALKSIVTDARMFTQG